MGVDPVRSNPAGRDAESMIRTSNGVDTELDFANIRKAVDKRQSANRVSHKASAMA